MPARRTCDSSRPGRKPLAVLSAIKLQRAWRKTFSRRTTRLFVQHNRSVGATSEHVKSISFEALVPFLREKPVIEAARQCLQRIHMLTTFRHGSPSKALVPENVNVRVFLAGFMIAYRPTHVFESMGKLEHALHDATKPMLASFEGICKHIHESRHHSFAEVPSALTKNFPTQLFHFLKSFKAWKVPDEQKLVLRIKHALIALYHSLKHLPFDEPKDSKISVEFHTQIERLRSKMQQIAGAEALKKFDEQLELQNLAGASSSSPSPTSSLNSAYASLPGRTSNEQLAHELLLNLQFELGDDGEGPNHRHMSTIRQIREHFHQAFWDSIVDDLKLEVPCYVRAIRLLKEVRDGINDLAHGREVAAIHEIVDLDFIQQQIEAGYYDFNSFKALIAGVVSVIRRVQAPKRDTETNDKWAEVSAEMDSASVEGQPRAIVKALEFLLNRVNVMRIDAANARLRLIAPVIKVHGIEYERDKFSEKLRNGSLTLERTTAWIDKAVKEQPAAAIDGLVTGQSASFVDVHIDAMISLVASPAEIRQDALPETLLFDVGHLACMQQELDYIASAAAMMLTVVDAAAPVPLKQATLESVSKLFLDDSKVEMDVAEVMDSIDNELQDASIEARQKARRTLPGCANAANPVKRLMHNRLKQVLGTALRTGNVNILGVVRLLAPRIEKMAAKFAHLCKINRDVHVLTYNKLIHEATSALRR